MAGRPRGGSTTFKRLETGSLKTLNPSAVTTLKASTRYLQSVSKPEKVHQLHQLHRHGIKVTGAYLGLGGGFRLEGDPSDVYGVEGKEMDPY